MYTFLIFAFLYAPILVLVVFSFNDSKSRVLWTGFSLKWYAKLFSDGEILRAVLNTLIVATAASVLATIIGVAGVVALKRVKKVPKSLIINVTNFPMINPEIVTGVSLMLLFVFSYNALNLLKPGLLTLILAHTVFCVPYVMLSVLPKFNQLNPFLYEAAQDLGCHPIAAFFKVVLPELFPGVVSGFMMAFTLSLDDFVISYFTSGTVQTLPIVIYSMTRKIVSPEINALSTVLFIVVMVLLILTNIKSSESLKRRAKIR